MLRGKLKETLFVTKEVVKLIWQTSKPYTIYTIILLTASAFIPIGEAYFIKKIIDLLTSSLSATVEFQSILFFIGLFVAVTMFGRFLEVPTHEVRSTPGFSAGYLLDLLEDAGTSSRHQFEYQRSKKNTDDNSTNKLEHDKHLSNGLCVLEDVLELLNFFQKSVNLFG